MDILTGSHAPLALVAISVAAGLAFALLTWLVSRALAEVPPEDRSYKDTPPLGFRLLWAPIGWIAHFISPRLAARRHALLLVRLGQAGVDFAINPAQFLASRLIGALLAASIFYWMMASFDHPAAGASGMPPSRYLLVITTGGLLGWAYPGIWLNDRISQRRRELLKTLPFYLDIITLCVEAGLNMQGALTQAVAKGPKGVLRD